MATGHGKETRSRGTKSVKTKNPHRNVATQRDKPLMPDVPKGASKLVRKAAAAQVAGSVEAGRRNAADLNAEAGPNPWKRTAATGNRVGFKWSTTNGELTDWRNPESILPNKAGWGTGPLEPLTKKTPPNPTPGARMGITRGFDPVFLFCGDKRCQSYGAMAQPSGRCPGGHVIEPPKKSQP